MKSIQVRFVRNCPPYEAGETKILRADDALQLIASGVAMELYEVRPSIGPQEIKPAGPTEVKEEFSGKKKVRTRKS